MIHDRTLSDEKLFSHPSITMCKVYQQSVFIPILITNGNEENGVVVMSDRNVESRAKERKGGDCSLLAGILLGAGILALLLPGSPCSCSFLSGQDDQSTPAVFLRGAATEMPDFYLDSHTTPIRHRESPPNTQLRFACYGHREKLSIFIEFLLFEIFILVCTGVRIKYAHYR
jgi:hypothetical protein